MCLGVPGKVVEVDGIVATVDFWGVCRQVRLDLVDEPVAPGDYVLNHVGYAIRRIPAEDIGETLALYESLLAEDADAAASGAQREDLMAADIRGEIAGTGGQVS
jgi:hydrogenase expression/formation protein HypC